MNREEILKSIAVADADTVEVYIDAVFDRKRELFPEWDIWYLAMPKDEAKELDERMRTLMMADTLLLFEEFEKMKDQPGWKERLMKML